ncbi:MAG: isoprenyl transferase [Anaerolineae bacterium]|nr:isoprenyl transferase [Chloroflexota bacterium]MCO6445990.1 isoprenyl transferase [Anaerolineae bacterium]GIK27005.1 MAG: isoprenyl transferase [Chloroflexota bacterium]
MAANVVDPSVTAAPLALPERVPRHVAIIMDGNGRWAAARGLPRSEGHRQGTENLRTIIRAAVEFGVEILTIYAFSTENWGRPRREVRLLLKILEMVIDRELRELHSNGVQIRHIGELDGIPPGIQRKVIHACEYTRHNTRLILNVAFNYGGRDEIVHAVRRIVQDGIPPDSINEDLIASYLYTSGLPDPDLIIRTSGELRVSNFLIWQGSYSEYYATDTLWPDFNREQFLLALIDFSKRRRRFGLTAAQVEDDHDLGETLPS